MVTPASVPSGPYQVNITVLNAIFQIRGIVRVSGTLSQFYNDETKPTFGVVNANILGTSLTNPAAVMTQPEMVVTKRHCQVIIVEGVPPTGAVTILPQIISLVVYTEHFAIMGKFSMNPGTDYLDFIEKYPTPFVPVTEARIFPLFGARPGIAGAASLGLIHKSMVRNYHKM